ncbi:hypothetical protein F4781DRAFT_7745 [Annulohypoxylon bovei var. microspora]|nr:hypothetical protein F4781DRAFT_7745 [Annulohypoxylon bovei var. microspora]
MWFAFGEDSKINPPNEEKAAPEVVAFAPYVQQEMGEEDPEELEETNSLGVTVGAEQVGKVAVEGKREAKHSFTRKHFDRGTAELIVSDDKAYGVNWYCEQNDLQKYGVKPHFYLAILLKRNYTTADKKPISFSGVFDMKIEAGSKHNITNGVRRAFRLGKPEDEAMYYSGNPESKVQVGGIENEGETIEAKVTKNELGKYMVKGELSKLLPELEPIAPKKAQQ